MAKGERHDFTEKTARILRERVGGKCSNPECRKPTTGPKDDPSKVANVGEAAHITAATADGPRFNPGLTAEERRAVDNGIWLCRKCHKLVDGEPAKYTVEDLLRWKAEAEQLAHVELHDGVASSHPEWFGKQPSSTHRFVGRQAELWDLHEQLNDSERVAVGGSRSVTQIHGLGGIGKSFLVQRYAQMFAHYWPGGICWLDATMPEGETSAPALEAHRVSQFAEVAVELGLDTEGLNAKQLTKLVRGHLASRERTLWIVDDLSPGLEQEDVEAWLVPAHVLFTTRSREYGAIANTVDLGVLSPGDGYGLLTSWHSPASPEEEVAAVQLAKNLGYHALALAVSAASVQRWGGYLEFQRYVNDGARQHDALEQACVELREQLPTGHERSITKTLARSILELGPEGLDLLLFCSNVSALAIPARFYARSVQAVDELSEENAATRQRMAWSETDSLSLSELTEEGSVTVHSLVSRVVRALEHAERRDALRRAALLALEESLPAAAEIGRHYSIREEISISRDLLTDESDSGFGTIAFWLGRHDHVRGLYGAARRFGEMAVKVRRRELGEEHPDTLTSMNSLGMTLNAQGNLIEAKKLHEEALEVRRRVLGEEHPNTLTSMANVALTYRNIGNLTEAKELQKNTLKVRRRVLEEEDPGTLKLTCNLAETLHALGDLAQARGLQEKTLEAQRRVLGLEHPDTLTSMNNLAGTLQDEGDLAGARELHEETLEAQIRVLGKEHPSTIASMNNLAHTYFALGDNDRARQLVTPAMASARKVWGDEHPSTKALVAFLELLES